MSIRKWLGLEREGDAERAIPPSQADAVRAIVDGLDRLEPRRARLLAGFAYILGRVAHVDLEISPEETRAMERAVRDLGGLTEEEAILVIQTAKAQHLLFGATENYVVTRDFAREGSREQRIALLECLFAVSAADRRVSGAEESEIRRIGKELELTHEDFIEARLKFREYIEALRGSAGPP